MNPNAAYNLACSYALAGLGHKAVEWLGEAVQAGFDDRRHLLRDPDFDSRFQDLFGRIMESWLVPGGIFVLEMPAELDPAEVTSLGPAEDTRKTAASRLAFWTRPVSA